MNEWCRNVSHNANTEHVGPGLASATTISPSHPVHHVTGTAAIQTISLPPGMTGPLRIIPDAAFTLGTSGNIAKATTAIVGQVLILTYDPETTKWYPNY